jgi:hypothetical protein
MNEKNISKVNAIVEADELSVFFRGTGGCDLRVSGQVHVLGNYRKDSPRVTVSLNLGIAHKYATLSPLPEVSVAEALAILKGAMSRELGIEVARHEP